MSARSAPVPVARRAFSLADGPSRPGGRLLDDFDLEHVVGKGNFGYVYRARHLPSGTTVAMKKMVLTDEESIHDVQKEVTVLEQINSANAVTYYGSFESVEDDGCRFVWIVMEYCAGGALSRVLKEVKEPLTEPQIALVCKSVLTALANMHADGKSHRDIKPENLLLTGAGEVKLSDFGVSGTFKGKQKMDTVIGTPFFLAPEMIQTEDGGYGPKVDVWALGISAMEMAELKVPNDDANAMRAVFLICENPAPRLDNSVRHWSKKFNDFVSRCLTKDPHKRPSAHSLLRHPFITLVAEQDSLALMPLVERMMEITSARRQQARPASPAVSVSLSQSLSHRREKKAASSPHKPRRKSLGDADDDRDEHGHGHGHGHGHDEHEHEHLKGSSERRDGSRRKGESRSSSSRDDSKGRSPKIRQKRGAVVDRGDGSLSSRSIDAVPESPPPSLHRFKSFDGSSSSSPRNIRLERGKSTPSSPLMAMHLSQSLEDQHYSPPPVTGMFSLSSPGSPTTRRRSGSSSSRSPVSSRRMHGSGAEAPLSPMQRLYSEEVHGRRRSSSVGGRSRSSSSSSSRSGSRKVHVTTEVQEDSFKPPTPPGTPPNELDELDSEPAAVESPSVRRRTGSSHSGGSKSRDRRRKREKDEKD